MRTRVPVVGGLLAVAVAAIALAPRSTVSASPSPTTSPRDLASLLHPLVASWRRSGPVLVVEHSEAPGATLLAVPLDGGTAIPLVAVPSPLQLGYDSVDGGTQISLYKDPSSIFIRSVVGP